MRLVDILMAFPGILLAIAFTAVLGPGLDHVILALCLIGWTSYARLVRGEILALREREVVQAARALGCKPSPGITRHLLPSLLRIWFSALAASVRVAASVVFGVLWVASVALTVGSFVVDSPSFI